MNRPTSLATRLAVAMSAVVVLTTLLAAAATGPLLRTATEQAARDGLGREADLLSRLPVAALAPGRADRVAAREDLQLGYVGPDGSRTGAALALSPADLTRLQQGEAVSTRGRLGDTAVLIEARPARAGGAVVLADDAAGVDRAVARQHRRVLLALVLGLVAGLGLALAVARWIARPLTAAATAARRLAAGERGVPLPPAPVREVSDMTDALGHLDAALRTSEERQRNFLLSVSHELRTPLTTVRGYAEALADRAIEPHETADIGQLLIAESARLERYVGDLLALARLEADDFTVDTAPVDLGGLVAELADAWQDRAARAGLLWETRLPNRRLVVTTDAGRLRQLLDGLIDNAVRVCPPGTRIVVRAEPTASGARIQVRDSGPGLADEDLPVAFTPGVLHQRYAADRPAGHGLGLSIAARLATRLGGSLTAAHAPEGGAEFTVELPAPGTTRPS